MDRIFSLRTMDSGWRAMKAGKTPRGEGYATRWDIVIVVAIVLVPSCEVRRSLSTIERGGGYEGYDRDMGDIDIAVL